MSEYLFGATVYASEHERWQTILKKAHAMKLRPVCTCVNAGEGPRMYLAHIRGAYVLKRMPDTGSLHAVFCGHYEPPQELSGLGQVAGTAIREHPENDVTNLALDFALSKGRSRARSDFCDVEHESVRSDGNKLTLRALLHYLWDQAGLTRWTPAMRSKRSWFVVQRELLAAAASKVAKGQALTDLLFIPEAFVLERQHEIKRRQIEALSRFAQKSTDRMLFIGSVKGFDEARFGTSLVIKHLPDLKLLMSDDMHRQLHKRFAHQLELWGQFDTTHLIVIATVSRSAQGVCSVESACLMNVNSNWIPFESAFELDLLEKLHEQERKFLKGLRYNLQSDKPLACAVLQDSGTKTVGLFVVPQALQPQYDSIFSGLEEKGEIDIWSWNVGSEVMPDLPVKT